MHNYRRIRTSIAESHKTGVGASDIPTLALLNLRYGQTPYQLWRVKTAREPAWAGNEATAWGHRLEGLILREAVRRRYDDVVAEDFYRAYLRGRSSGELKVLTEFRHPAYRWALAHPDLLIEDSRLIEAKSHGYHAARRTGDPDYGYSAEDHSQNGIPAAVFLQVQWQAFCAGLEEVDLAVLINTNDYREYGPVLADPRTQEKCLALAERFWWHVERDEPPKPENWEDVRRLFPQVQPTTAMIAGDAELAARQMKERAERMRKAIERMKGRIEDMKNAMGLLIGGNSVLATAEGQVLAKAWETGRWYAHEVKKLEQTEPDLFRKLVDGGYLSRSEWRELRW